MSNNVETVSSSAFEKGLKKAWEKYLSEGRKKKYPNIMLLGISGAGKSTLVNTVFGVDIAGISDVAPKTEGCDFYDGHEYSRKVNLIDTAGYKLNQSETYFSTVKNAINHFYCEMPVQVLWYCISLANERIEEIDIRTLNELQKIDGVKERLCIVFTKCDEDDDESSKETSFKEILKKRGLFNIPTFEASNDSNLNKELNFNELIKWSSKRIKDEDFYNSFIGSQMADLLTKKNAAEEVINRAVVKIGLVQFSSAIGGKNNQNLLAELLMEMSTEIFSVYGIDCLTGLMKEIDAAKGVFSLGHGIVSVFVTIVPKAAKLEKIIDGAMASALSKAVGEAVSAVCYSYVEKHLKGEQVKFEDFFSDASTTKLFLSIVSNGFSGTGKILSGIGKKNVAQKTGHEITPEQKKKSDSAKEQEQSVKEVKSALRAKKKGNKKKY